MSRGANLNLNQSAASGVSDPAMASIEQFVDAFGGTRAIDKVVVLVFFLLKTIKTIK